MVKYIVPVILFVFFVAPANSQTKAAALNTAEVQRFAAEREAEHNRTWTDPHEQLARAQAAQMVTHRQTELRRETEKLLALATELKLHVDQSDANVLSLDVIRKAAEIQKLAKSVQEKMKSAY